MGREQERLDRSYKKLPKNPSDITRLETVNYELTASETNFNVEIQSLQQMT